MKIPKTSDKHIVKNVVLAAIVLPCSWWGGGAFGELLSERFGGGERVVTAANMQISVDAGPASPVEELGLSGAQMKVSDEGRPGRGRTTSVATIEELESWLARDPAAAMAWYAGGGWRTLGDDPASIKERMADLSANVAKDRSQLSYGWRLGWSSLPRVQLFSLVNQWDDGHGTKLAAKIAESPQGADMMWMVADGNPAHSWPDTAEWVAGLKVDEGERSAVVDQMARRSVENGEGASAAVVFAGHPEPVYDQAKASLAADLAQTDPTSAKTAWDSISTPTVKLTAAIRVLSNPKIDAATKQMVAQWAEQSGAASTAGSTWGAITSKP